MNHKNSLFCALAALVVSNNPVSAATLVIDSFTEADFFLSVEGDTSITSDVSTPFGTRRFSRISDRIAASGTVMTSTLDSSAGTLSFNVNGQSTGSSPLDLRASYSQGGPFSVLGYNAFEFDFSALEGSGSLIIELGSGSAVYGPSANRVTINSAGTLSVPFTSLNFGTGGSVPSFQAMHFTFEADTDQFSFTLDEVRVVPEPGASILLLLGAGSMALRRRR